MPEDKPAGAEGAQGCPESDQEGGASKPSADCRIQTYGRSPDPLITQA